VVPSAPVAALVISAMAPDFEYVLKLAPRGRTWHTPLGLVVFTIPAAVIIWMLWRRLVAPAVQVLLPRDLQGSLRQEALTWANLTRAVLAAALGAASHVAWDGLTHVDGWAVAQWPTLGTPVVVAGTTVPFYRTLQHTSTLVGAAALAMWAMRWWRRQPPGSRVFTPRQRLHLIIALGALTTSGALGAALNAMRAPPGELAIMIGYAAVGAMAAAAAVTLSWAIVFRIRSTARGE
jgi:hypothetical protein